MFLPAEPVLAVCEQLRLRFGAPMWQFTTSASAANMEALRIARAATGGPGTLLFAGKYHGMLDATLWSADGTGLTPEGLGLSSAPADLAVVHVNDLEAGGGGLGLEGTRAALI